MATVVKHAIHDNDTLLMERHTADVPLIQLGLYRICDYHYSAQYEYLDQLFVRIRIMYKIGLPSSDNTQILKFKCSKNFSSVIELNLVQTKSKQLT